MDASRILRRCVALALLLGATACSVPRWPVAGTLTSPFGLRRDGVGLTIHRGVDISLPHGSGVLAMAAGTVAYAGTMGGYGRVVIIDHGRGVRSLYAHLSEIRVERAQEIAARALIGLSGSSGNATGPHLHFEILRRGRAEDPVPLLGGFPSARH